MNCARCGAECLETANYCPRCGVPLTPGAISAPRPHATPGKPISGKAVTSLILGLVSFCGLFPIASIPGIVFGVLGRREIKREPDRLSGEGLAITGIALCAVSIVVGAIAVVYFYFFFAFMRTTAVQNAGFQSPYFQVAAMTTPQKVARAQSDMRSLDTAIQMYFIDCAELPAMTRTAADGVDSQYMFMGGAWTTPTFRRKSGPSDPMMTLTTPISYLTEFPFDPFADIVGRTYRYFTPDHASAYIIWSAGPDGDFDIRGIPGEFNLLNPFNDPVLIDKTYDPTNGEFSDGDVWRVGRGRQ